MRFFPVATVLLLCGINQSKAANWTGQRGMRGSQTSSKSSKWLFPEAAKNAGDGHSAKTAKLFKTKDDEMDMKAKSAKNSGAKGGKTCLLEPIPTNPADFNEPMWEDIIETAFPSYDTPANGCPRLDVLGGELVADYTEFPVYEDKKWNPCYYTKGFAGLDPELGGYPTPLDTHYQYEFAAPFFGQPGDGSTHHCDGDATVDIGSCPKLGADCGPDCAKITDDYGIGHIPPFVPLAAIKNAYDKCGTSSICSEWFHYPTSGCNIKKSVIDELVYEYFGDEDTIKFQPPILLGEPAEPSNTYFRLEYGGEQPACKDGNCRGPHYCTPEVVDGTNIWGDFCPYVHTGENSGKYRHPHIALAALELWIANQCMPEKCAAEWLESPNGKDYAADNNKATSITWAEMDDNDDPISQPAVPYVWPNAGDGKYPGLDVLYPDGTCAKPAPGVYVTEFAGKGPQCDTSSD